MLTDATRTRLSFTGEFFIAAAFLVATAAVGLLIARELRVTPRASAAGSAAPAPAEAVPADSVSIPALMLGETSEIRVGDRVEPALARLGTGATLVKQSSSEGLLGLREIRSYELSGTKFMLVLEPFERGGEPRVAAIYLQ
jgi:hypothetical protein